MSKIIPFENEVDRFFKEVGQGLELVLKSHNGREEKLEILHEEVLEEYEWIPEYCYGIVLNLKMVASDELKWREKEEIIKDTITFCKLLREKPSIKVFKQLVDMNYPTLWCDTRFSTNLFYIFMQDLITKQKRYKRIIETTQNERERRKHLELLNQNAVWWTAISRMPQVTEKLLLKIVSSAEMSKEDFYIFCVETVVSQNATENVMIALIRRIQKERLESISRYVADEVKAELVLTLFGLNKPGLTAIMEAVRLIRPGDGNYYKFYHYAIINSRGSVSLLGDIKEKVEMRSFCAKKEIAEDSRKLSFLLRNMLPQEEMVAK